MATAQPTTDHDQIRRWVEARGGHPARVKATGRRKDPGILRIDFPGFSGEDTLEEIEWDEFFEWFDRNGLAMLLSPARGNRFNKLVSRKTVQAAASKKRAASKRVASRKTASKKAASAKKASAKKVTSSKKASSTKKATSSKKATTKKASTKKASSTKKVSSSKKAASSKKTTSAKKASSSKKASSTKKRTSSKKASSSSSITTTSHDEIRRWVESRGGYPATVKGTEERGEEAGLLRIDYPGYSGKDTLQRIEWDDFFEKFDSEKLAFLYQNKRGSRFSKLVRR